MELIINLLQFSVTLLGFCLSGIRYLRHRTPEFAEDFHKNGAFCRADIGIGPYDAFKDSVGIFELVLVSQERFKKTESVFFRRSKRKSCTAVANS